MNEGSQVAIATFPWDQGLGGGLSGSGLSTPANRALAPFFAAGVCYLGRMGLVMVWSAATVNNK